MLGKVTLGLFFLLLVWGNLVAGMRAGLGCPDWPLCHGRVVPPFRWDIYMEFTHRVIAAAATFFLFALSYRRFREYRGPARIVPVMAVSLVAATIVLGGFVVLFGLPVQLTTVHFMAGLGVFVLVYYMKAFDGDTPPRFSLRGFSGLFFALGALIFFQAALGSYVRHSDAGLVCPDFPTCMGRFFPAAFTKPVLVQFSHRLMAYFIFLTAAALYASTLVDRRASPHQPRAFTLLVLVAVQIGVGASVVLLRLAYIATALHLAVALSMLYVVSEMWSREALREEAPL